MFTDSQSLFLRHVQSGKCIAAGHIVYDSGGWALPFWAIMTENCLNVSAQFRYLDSEILYNIGKDGTFVSVDSNSNYQKRLAIYKAVDPRSESYRNNQIHRLKQTANGTLYFYNKAKICAETSQSDNYVKGEKACEGKPEQNFTFGNIHCSATGISITGGGGGYSYIMLLKYCWGWNAYITSYRNFKFAISTYCS